MDLFSLIPIVGTAVKVLPSLAGLFGGNASGGVVDKAVDTVKAVAKEIFGTDDPKEIEAKIAQDASLTERFKARLQAETETLRMEHEDRQNARAQTVDLAKAGSAIAWGAPVVSFIVTIAFSGILTLWLFFPPPTGNAAALAVLNMLVGTLATAFGAVVNYWLGSSAGSAAKDALMRAPPPVITKK